VIELEGKFGAETKTLFDYAPHLPRPKTPVCLANLQILKNIFTSLKDWAFFDRINRKGKVGIFGFTLPAVAVASRTL
jgi:hypothetical protein